MNHLRTPLGVLHFLTLDDVDDVDARAATGERESIGCGRHTGSG
jgi:hypothetical protein